MNTFAGGGSLLTLPLLIFLGLPPAVANGTNRVAIVIQNITAVLGFRSKGVSDFKLSGLLAIPALAGAYLGAKIAIDLPEETFNRVLAVIMVVVLMLILWNPTRKLHGDGDGISTRRKVAAAVVFFLIGIYGGFIQAGVGFIFMAALVGIFGMDLVRVNAVKALIILVYTLLALYVFAVEGKVDWVLGLVLSVGNGMGGWLTGRFSVTKGERWIRPVLIVCVLAFALKLSGLIPGWS
ncbi:MAG: sulfite exporter TauE/SafE family protein [Chloroflexi bacterium]|nr:sulfite exporter TauE/SafE family protein [Chloroflexota bacterium]